ncbi:GNAT family N-acetyltransferase [Nocardia pseudovaccinii]|uniref:GNAT family N-acetyltransferase n=1 Tax=Nocardia pseudovaccinii TaxID=189540 RepID=UPI000B00AEAF|nr:GNAT family N-acetyltransferase [Nocardia pseudovaccinii]
MNLTDIRWSAITERTEVKKHPFHEFSCTEPYPRTPEGRKMPHPKPWEWTAQSIIRQSSRCLKAGSLLIVGWSNPSNEILAVAHAIPEVSTSLFSVHVAAIGVSRTVRGRGGSVADRTLEEVHSVVLENARESGAVDVVATANIHTRNFPSQRLFERAGYEPRSVPSGELQQWICRLDN